MLIRCSTLPSRLIALAINLFLALPPGWCCSAFAAIPTFAASEKEPATKSCCCCSGLEAPTQSPSQSPEKNTPPIDPCSSPCCERLPTLLVAGHDGVPDLAAPMIVAVVDFPPPLAIELPSRVVPHCDTSPPLRILLCSWLC